MELRESERCTPVTSQRARVSMELRDSESCTPVTSQIAWTVL
jgi:hypothetical protein